MAGREEGFCLHLAFPAMITQDIQSNQSNALLHYINTYICLLNNTKVNNVCIIYSSCQSNVVMEAVFVFRLRPPNTAALVLNLIQANTKLSNLA